jgi:hypothetical protein
MAEITPILAPEDGAAAGGDDATGLGRQLSQNPTFQIPEGAFSLPGKKIVNRRLGDPFQDNVGVEKAIA